MSVTANNNQDGIENSIAHAADVDFESGHRVINALLEALQHHFKHDMRYGRPMMTPQFNILFALDRDTAENMANYMTAKLAELGGFAEGEFRFTHKARNDEVLQRLRLEFVNGVNAHIIRKLLIAIDHLERALPQHQA